MNDTQKKIYDYLVTRTAKGIPPTVREIANQVGLKSTSSVQTNIIALEKLGLIERDPLKKRSIRICNNEESTRTVPLVGVVTAGTPITAVENIESYIPFKYDKISSDKELFALRVKGESMINIGIFDGDVIIVERTPTALNGEVVVAMIDDEATVKTFYKENGYFRLQPENASMEPIIAKEVIILGKVIALHRYY